MSLHDLRNAVDIARQEALAENEVIAESLRQRLGSESDGIRVTAHPSLIVIEAIPTAATRITKGEPVDL